LGCGWTISGAVNTLASLMDNLPDLGQLDLNAVRVFAEVAGLGGFRQAAARLKLPKSTASAKVAALEAALGQQLLRRTTRTVALTEAGEEFLRQAGPALASLGEAARALQEAQARPRGRLRVTAPPTFAELFLGPLLVRFARDYPEVRVALDLSDRRVDLVKEGFDVALRTGALPDSSLRARLLGSAPAGCFASPAYLRRKGRPRRPEDLAGHDLLAFAPDDRQVQWPFPARPQTQQASAKRAPVRPLKLSPRFTINSFLLLEQLAEEGLGIARLPAGLAAEGVARGRLVEVLADWAVAPQPMHAVFAPSQHLSPKVRVFLDAVSRHFEGAAWPPEVPRRR
jgi:DNA-binding transcriptional LysR family regulator